MKFHIFIGRTCLFQILGVLGGIFHFYSNLKRNFCKQTAENLMRRSVLASDLVLHCLPMPHKRTSCLYGLIAYINCAICVNVHQTYKLVAAKLQLYLLWLNAYLLLELCSV